MSNTLLLVGPNGSGKSHRFQQLIAMHAADPTSTTWAVDPHHELTAADRHTTPDGAEQFLTDALALVEQRNSRGREHTATEAEPRVLLLVDEAEQLLRQQPLADLLHRLAVTGRKAGVETALAVRDTTLQVWPLGLRQQYLTPENAEVLPPRRHHAED